MLAPGSTLGPYEIRGRLGTGGMGEVYRALDPRLSREVAIKVLPVDLAASPRALVRFDREARAVAALSHPNILVIHDVGATGELRYVVTELLAGQSLSSRLGAGPLPWREAAALGLAVAEGLQAAHARGIVHRDLKPANLFLTHDGRIKILDFGVARFLQGDPTTGGERTLPGSVLGSVGYMSPEQAAGEEIDARSDLFSLGCVLYEALTGRRAFAGANLPQTLAALARDQPAPIRELAPEVPPELVAVVERLLRKRPRDRFAGAAEAAFALRTTGSATLDLQAPSPRPSAGERLRRWASGLLAAVKPHGGPRSLAVLPFVATGGDGDADYLGEGLAEGIVRTLAQLPDVRVLAWSTVAAWRGRVVEPRTAASALGVEAVLVGRLHLRGEELALSVELVEARRGSLLWAERYERTSADLVELHGEIARELARRLRGGSSGSRRDRLGRGPTLDAEAYRLYLKGRYFWNRRTEEGLAKSREHFRLAIDRDPAFALAYAGLADAFHVLPFWGLLPPVDAFAQGKAAARAALQLDPRLAEAHAALAYALFWFDWDWPTAQAEFRAALDLDPGYATAHHGYGVCLALTGSFAAADESLRRAQAIEPLSLIVQADQALVRWWQGDWEGARTQCRSVLELDSEFAPAHLYLGLACQQLGLVEPALEALRKAAAAGGTAARAALAHGLATAGDLEEARRGLAELAALAERRYVSPYLIGVVHAGLGEVEEAHAWLERGLQQRCEMMPWLERDPRLQPLAALPRFARLAREVRGGRSASGQVATVAELTPRAG
jgi:serine/threonine-protein kinase